MILAKPVNMYMHWSPQVICGIILRFFLLLPKIADVVRVINGRIFVRIILTIVIEKIFTVH